MRVFLSEHEQRLCVVVAGELDFDTVATFEAATATLRRPWGFAVVELDLAELRFLDCAGVAAILGLQADVTAAGPRLVIVDPRPIVDRVLELTGAYRLIPIRVNQDAARLGRRWWSGL
jgi:anti-sigma B factor antagonist